MRKETLRVIYINLFLVFMALSVGNPSYWLPSIVLTLLLLYAFVSAKLASLTLDVKQHINQNNIPRGSTIDINVSISIKSFLPIAPVKLYMHDNMGKEVLAELKEGGLRSYQYTASHVGKFFPGIDYCVVGDIFNLFAFKVDKQTGGEALFVNPKPFDIESLKFGVGDTGAETIRRALEDISSPSGVRKYQMGDPLKKIHWKLSLRKNELMVRQYDEPTLPTTSILMDVAPPYVSKNASNECIACLKDAVLETAASIAISQMRLENNVKLPIMGSSPFIFNGNMGEHVLLEKLTTVSFDENEMFERLIMLDMESLRLSGAIAAVTTRLSSNLAEILSQIAMKGSTVRLYLVTYGPDNPVLLPMINRLQSRRVEVCYVIPEQTEGQGVEDEV